jgi:Mce-associated membrane protein
VTSSSTQNLGAATASAEQAGEETKEPVAVPANTETTATEVYDATAGDADIHDSVDPDDEETIDAPTDAEDYDAAAPKDGQRWRRVLACGVLPALALLLALGAGFLKWQDSSIRAAEVARIESTQAAKDATVRLLSYRPDTVDKDLGAARELLTGDFKNAYTSLTKDVVIPGAKQKQISAVASVPAGASISADAQHAEVVVFVDQTVIMGNDAPTSTNSSIKVTLDNVDGRWLISKFDPV